MLLAWRRRQGDGLASEWAKAGSGQGERDYHHPAEELWLRGIIWSLGHGSLDVGSLDRGLGQGGGAATPSGSNTGMLWKTEVLWLT